MTWELRFLIFFDFGPIIAILSFLREPSTLATAWADYAYNLVK
jgi:hypothetical protein